jgi:alpha-1,3-mannosyltransferase
MEQVELFRGGERDYTELIGPCGPANYPAGFIYVYWVMQVLTGQDYRLGQVIHAFLYAFLHYMTLKIFLMIHKKEEVWKLSLFLVFQLYNRNSALLFLFNDIFISITMAICVYLMMKQKLISSMIAYAVSTTIKAGAIIYLPGFLLLITFFQGLPMVPLLVLILIGAHYLVAWPFLETNASGYWANAFNVSVHYTHGNSASWRFLVPDERAYYHPNKILILRVIMLVLFALFLVFKWTRLSTFFADVRLYPFTVTRKFVSPRKIALIMASSAVIALFCGPCSHCQFVQWCDFLTPVLFMGADLLVRERVVLFALIQIFWDEWYLGQCELFVREIYSAMGFLGYLGLIWAMFFVTDYLKDDDKT